MIWLFLLLCNQPFKFLTVELLDFTLFIPTLHEIYCSETWNIHCWIIQGLRSADRYGPYYGMASPGHLILEILYVLYGNIFFLFFREARCLGCMKFLFYCWMGIQFSIELQIWISIGNRQPSLLRVLIIIFVFVIFSTLSLEV